MKKLIIKVDCETTKCGMCSYLDDLEDGYCMLFDQELELHEQSDDYLRIIECIEAEESDE